MAESFTNALARSVGVVTTNSGVGAVGVTTNLITGISTVGLATGYLVVNQHFRQGAVVSSIGAGQCVVSKDSTNTSSAATQDVNFLGFTTAYTSDSGTKAILIGGTFSNLSSNQIKIYVGMYDSSANEESLIASDIPVPSGSSFVISDAGKTVMEGSDAIRVYCDTATACDVTLGILKGVS